MRWYQGRMASWESQRHSVVSPIVATKPRLMTSRLISEMLKRDSGSPSVQGNSQARAFTSTTVSGGKERGPAAPREFLEAGEAFLEEALPPFADDLSRCIEPVGDLIVGEAGSGIETIFARMTSLYGDVYRRAWASSLTLSSAVRVIGNGLVLGIGLGLHRSHKASPNGVRMPVSIRHRTDGTGDLGTVPYEMSLY